MNVIRAMFILLLCSLPAYSQNSTITLKETDITVVELIKKVSRHFDYSFVIDPSIKGKLSLSVKDQSLDQVLKLIIRTNRDPITYEKVGETLIFKVKRVETSNRISVSNSSITGSSSRRTETIHTEIIRPTNTDIYILRETLNFDGYFREFIRWRN